MTETPTRPIPTKADAAKLLEEQASIRKRAARQSAMNQIELTPPEMVKCRVTHKGDGKVSMGIHVPELGEAHFEKNETFEAIRSTAEELQERGFVEII